ncbi:hypothetical protein [Brevibacillus fortis]|uniref:Uncharacterized protein n=1 Tax=Brevibacillus fortis TaxID=2126352 RepID=A0A2P7UJY0_9BACL|nr:hypothetical protein [Brevibacillus fortis]PSJ87259.1 hypothetical protein C7R93_27355 [Brevibacillus fortis]
MMSIFKRLFRKNKSCNVSYSVKAYLDKNNELLIIPHALDQDGLLRDINFPTKLSPPHNPAIIGSSLKNSFLFSKKDYTFDELNVQVFTLATGIKSYSKFSRDRQLVMVMFDEPNQSYSFAIWRRVNKGAYISTDEPSTILSGDVSDIELGQALLNSYLSK